MQSAWIVKKPKIGDRIRSNYGAMNRERLEQKQKGLAMSEEDYILTNQRTGGKANIRKNDYEIEDAHAWLKELEDEGLI